MAADTIPARLWRNAATMSDRPALREKVGGAYRSVSWAEYAGLVRRAGKALISLGLEPGGSVAILGFNRPEWVVTYLGAMAVGGTAAGVYTTASADEAAFVIGHAPASVVLAEGAAELGTVLARRVVLPGLRWVVTMRGAAPSAEPGVLTWEEFLARGDEMPDGEFERRLAGLAGSDPATLIYTSGTTGAPKGVVLTHDNLTWTADRAPGVFGLSPEDVLLSYLPLSHIAEQMYAVHVAITFGYTVAFAESLEAVRANLGEVRPTLFFGVPRVWDKLAAAVRARLAEVHGAKAVLAGWAMGVARRTVLRRHAGLRPGLLLGLQYRLARRLFHHRVKAALGLDRCHFAASGAAPADVATLELLAGLDVPVYEVFGLSETSGPATWNRPGKARLGTVGPAYPGVEIRLEGDGEILVRGGNVFARYHRDPDATAAAFRDGWFATGDLGALDAAGFLTIIGRKKELIVTAGGKNVAPAPMEAALKRHPLVGEAVVVGDRRPYLTALISLDAEAGAAYAAAHALAGPLHEAPGVQAEVARLVDEVNAGAARSAQIRRFTVLGRPLTITDGELTGTLKVKRAAVLAHFAAEIEGMYRDEQGS
jgi:long-chain acyl-CoA synthetase